MVCMLSCSWACLGALLLESWMSSPPCVLEVKVHVISMLPRKAFLARSRCQATSTHSKTSDSTSVIFIQTILKRWQLCPAARVKRTLLEVNGVVPRVI